MLHALSMKFKSSDFTLFMGDNGKLWIFAGGFYYYKMTRLFIWESNFLKATKWWKLISVRSKNQQILFIFSSKCRRMRWKFSEEFKEFASATVWQAKTVWIKSRKKKINNGSERKFSSISFLFILCRTKTKYFQHTRMLAMAIWAVTDSRMCIEELKVSTQSSFSISS